MRLKKYPEPQLYTSKKLFESLRNEQNLLTDKRGSLPVRWLAGSYCECTSSCLEHANQTVSIIFLSAICLQYEDEKILEGVSELLEIS